MANDGVVPGIADRRPLAPATTAPTAARHARRDAAPHAGRDTATAPAATPVPTPAADGRSPTTATPAAATAPRRG